METKRIKVLESACLFLLSVMIAWTVHSAQAQTIGKTVDKSNWKEYEVLLNAPQLRAVQTGEWTYPTGNLRFPGRHADRFLSASEKNAGKFDVDKNGHLIDKATGKFPEYNVYGLPFPKIDPKDPNAGVKVMWNFNFQQYRNMAFDQRTRLMWVGKAGPDGRYFHSNVYHIYYQGRAPGREMSKNPDKFLYQDLISVTEPMDLKGTNTLSWEYSDLRGTTVFMYLPVIRRVRRTSGASRSDPFLGSDSWMDSMENWAGKNASFTWKLLGERTLLVAFNSLDKQIAEETPDGSLTIRFPPKYGFETPGWKGSPWAMTSVTWVPRPVWVVEGMPKDPYYAYGKHIFYVDKEIYYIPQKEVFDKAGEFWHWNPISTVCAEGLSGSHSIGFPTGLVALDTKIPHATPVTVYSARLFRPTSSLGADRFSMANFLQLTK